MKLLKSLIPYIIIIVVVVLIRTLLFSPALVNGSSMENTLYDGEIVIVNKIGLLSGIDRFDIVIVKVGDELLIKRVIALPNEKIEYKDNVLYINDEEIETPIEFEYTNDFVHTTGYDEYFVMGDNRDVSQDSRILGAFNKQNIEGKVDLVLYPFNKIGFVK